MEIAVTLHKHVHLAHLVILEENFRLLTHQHRLESDRKPRQEVLVTFKAIRIEEGKGVPGFLVDEPGGLAAKIFRQLLHKRIQILQVLVESVMYLGAQLRKQLIWKGVLVVESIDDRHALLNLLVSEVETLHHGADYRDAVSHEQSAKQHDE